MGKESKACKPQCHLQGTPKDWGGILKFRKEPAITTSSKSHKIVTAYPGKAKFQVVLAAITSKNKVYQKNVISDWLVIMEVS